MEILSIQLSDDALISISKQLTLMTGFVVQGHKYINYQEKFFFLKPKYALIGKHLLWS